ncbi:MAG: hypothetical protein HYS80_00935 [Candidatus Aenigmarchaeota archaeon]|nr:hypothetical protein [Candidatus Aenigmarchaeota archaeon]
MRESGQDSQLREFLSSFSEFSLALKSRDVARLVQAYSRTREAYTHLPAEERNRLQANPDLGDLVPSLEETGNLLRQAGHNVPTFLETSQNQQPTERQRHEEIDEFDIPPFLRVTPRQRKQGYERAGELVLNGKYSPVRWARKHPALAAGAAGLLFSELSVHNLPLQIRLGIDIAMSSMPPALAYAYTAVKSHKRDDMPQYSSNIRKAMLIGLPNIMLANALLWGYTLSHQGQEQAVPAQPRQEQRQTIQQSQQLQATSYFGDQFTAEFNGSIGKGGRCTVNNVGYDFNSSPTLVLGCDDFKIFIGYNAGGKDQFDRIYQRLKGKNIELTREPFGNYTDNRIGSGIIYSPETVKVGNQTLFEFLK